VKGHPLLWLVVLTVGAAGSFWTGVDGAKHAAFIGRTYPDATFQLYFWACVQVVAGLVMLYYAGRVARLCWKMYATRPPAPPGCCRRCWYDLTGNVSGVCPECGRHFRSAASDKSS
jgi:hypothetical protein